MSGFKTCRDVAVQRLYVKIVQRFYIKIPVFN
jgi:hypothetical protein